jgi:hypothetical protein
MRAERIPVLAGLLAALSLAGCVKDAPRWENKLILTHERVEGLLGLNPAGFDQDLLPPEIPVIPLKEHLRPCCAFGYELRPELAVIPIPGIRLRNVTSRARLGPHRYDGGMVSLTRDEDQQRSNEGNGQVYTCRGGFIDIAHVRDNADWTMYLVPTLARILELGGRLELPAEGARRTVVLAPVPPEWIESHGRRRLAVAMGQWMAYQTSIWHEIATWYGWSAIWLFPERASAFSPEDLYSNALGARLTGGLIAMRAVGTDRTYERAIDRWLQAALEELGAVDTEDAIAAADQVDGVWWDSQRRVPDERLVQRRTLELSMPLVPWTVGRRGAAARAWEAASCPGGAEPLPIEIDDHLGDIRFADLLTLEIGLDSSLRARIPSQNGVVTQADFPRIVAAIQREARVEFGSRAGDPEE